MENININDIFNNKISNIEYADIYVLIGKNGNENVYELLGNPKINSKEPPEFTIKNILHSQHGYLYYNPSELNSFIQKYNIKN